MSTVVKAKEALVSVLSGSAALSGVQVSYGDDVARPRKERMYLGDVDQNEAHVATMRAGRVRMQEEYALHLLVLADSKKGQATCEGRVLEMVAALRDILELDPKLDTAAVPPGIITAVYAGFTLHTSIVSEGEYRTIANVEIEIMARNV